jgi:ubiquinone/menaquinone biosynthesis C-methylase UbiE
MEREPTQQAAPAGSPLATKEPWDIVADAYTADLLPSWAEHFAREALQLASLPPSPSIVDVATGPGTLALLAAKDGATVSAIDFSPAMVANLRRRANKLGLAIADARIGDGQDLPFDDNAFDGAFSMVGLIFFPDRGAGFRELHRVLRPGRRAVVSSFASIEGPLAQVLDGIRALLPNLPLSDGKMPLSDPEEFTHEMSSAGFHEVTIHTVTHLVTTPSLTEFWQKTQRSAAPVALLRRKLGEERWVEVANGVFNQLHETLGDGPVEELYTVHLGVGVK